MTEWHNMPYWVRNTFLMPSKSSWQPRCVCRNVCRPDICCCPSIRLDKFLSHSDIHRPPGPRPHTARSIQLASFSSTSRKWNHPQRTRSAPSSAERHVPIVNIGLPPRTRRRPETIWEVSRRKSCARRARTRRRSNILMSSARRETTKPK